MVSFVPANVVNHYSFSAQNSLGGFGIAGHLAPFLVAAFQSGRYYSLEVSNLGILSLRVKIRSRESTDLFQTSQPQQGRKHLTA